MLTDAQMEQLLAGCAVDDMAVGVRRAESAKRLALIILGRGLQLPPSEALAYFLVDVCDPPPTVTDAQLVNVVKRWLKAHEGQGSSSSSSSGTSDFFTEEQSSPSAAAARSAASSEHTDVPSTRSSATKVRFSVDEDDDGEEDEGGILYDWQEDAIEQAAVWRQFRTGRRAAPFLVPHGHRPQGPRGPMSPRSTPSSPMRRTLKRTTSFGSHNSGSLFVSSCSSDGVNPSPLTVLEGRVGALEVRSMPPRMNVAIRAAGMRAPAGGSSGDARDQSAWEPRRESTHVELRDTEAAEAELYKLSMVELSEAEESKHGSKSPSSQERGTHARSESIASSGGSESRSLRIGMRLAIDYGISGGGIAIGTVTTWKDPYYVIRFEDGREELFDEATTEHAINLHRQLGDVSEDFERAILEGIELLKVPSATGIMAKLGGRRQAQRRVLTLELVPQQGTEGRRLPYLVWHKPGVRPKADARIPLLGIKALTGRQASPVLKEYFVQEPGTRRLCFSLVPADASITEDDGSWKWRTSLDFRCETPDERDYIVDQMLRLSNKYLREEAHLVT